MGVVGQGFVFGLFFLWRGVVWLQQPTSVIPALCRDLPGGWVMGWELQGLAAGMVEPGTRLG